MGQRYIRRIFCSVTCVTLDKKIKKTSRKEMFLNNKKLYWQSKSSYTIEKNP